MSDDAYFILGFAVGALSMMVTLLVAYGVIREVKGSTDGE